MSQPITDKQVTETLKFMPNRTDLARAFLLMEQDKVQAEAERDMLRDALLEIDAEIKAFNQFIAFVTGTVLPGSWTTPLGAKQT